MMVAWSRSMTCSGRRISLSPGCLTYLLWPGAMTVTLPSNLGCPVWVLSLMRLRITYPLPSRLTQIQGYPPMRSCIPACTNCHSEGHSVGSAVMGLDLDDSTHILTAPPHGHLQGGELDVGGGPQGGGDDLYRIETLVGHVQGGLGRFEMSCHDSPRYDGTGGRSGGRCVA